MKKLFVAILAMVAFTVTPASASTVTHHPPAGCSVVIDGKHPAHYRLRSGQSLRFPDLKVFCWQGTTYIDVR